MKWWLKVLFLQRGDDGGAVGRLGLVDRVGQQPHRGVGHEDLVAEEQALGLDALLQFGARLSLGLNQWLQSMMPLAASGNSFTNL
jgi:hypothetical protein